MKDRNNRFVILVTLITIFSSFTYLLFKLYKKLQIKNVIDPLHSLYTFIGLTIIFVLIFIIIVYLTILCISLIIALYNINQNNKKQNELENFLFNWSTKGPINYILPYFSIFIIVLTMIITYLIFPKVISIPLIILLIAIATTSLIIHHKFHIKSIRKLKKYQIILLLIPLLVIIISFVYSVLTTASYIFTDIEVTTDKEYYFKGEPIVISIKSDYLSYINISSVKYNENILYPNYYQYDYNMKDIISLIVKSNITKENNKSIIYVEYKYSEMPFLSERTATQRFILPVFDPET